MISRGGYQPMAKANGARTPGRALTNARRGRSAYGQNPADITRKAQRKRRKRRPKGALAKMIAASKSKA